MNPVEPPRPQNRIEHLKTLSMPDKVRTDRSLSTRHRLDQAIRARTLRLISQDRRGRCRPVYLSNEQKARAGPSAPHRLIGGAVAANGEIVVIRSTT